jgi:isopentenyl-diphosphate delta-isomerase
MSGDDHIAQRKLDHMRAALEQDLGGRGSAFDRFRAVHNALPEIALDSVDTGCEFLGRRIAAPFMIASLTGGAPEAGIANRNLARAAQAARVPLALGSAKIVFRDPGALDTFHVRALCPDIPLLANLGLADLGRRFSIDDCARLVETLEADALIFHINPLHEAMQARGATDFTGLGALLGDAVQQLDIPVIVKEVGHGVCADVFRRLDACGVYGVDIAGQGGTSWGLIEEQRAQDDPQRAAVCRTFRDWGLCAPDILDSLYGIKRNARLIASGGVRNGVDVFKCLCLGADMAAAALPLLAPALHSAEAAAARLDIIIRELRLALFATGCPTPGHAHRGLLIPA